MKQNCWEFKNCGRAAGGEKTGEMGVCPVSESTIHDGVNGGKNGGRFCWKVSGTYCQGQVQGSYAQKIVNCSKCDFFNAVKTEEGAALKVL
jgi:hypothetical protein